MIVLPDGQASRNIASTDNTGGQGEGVKAINEYDGDMASHTAALQKP